MQFTEAEIKEFIEIWKDEFHERITDAEARLSASALMELYALLLSPQEE